VGAQAGCSGGEVRNGVTARATLEPWWVL